MAIIKGVNFGSYLFASFFAGYVMMGLDLMLDGFLGLFGTYKYYIEMTKIWGIFKGLEDWITILGHMLNSLILAVVFVHPSVYFKLPGNGLIKGFIFGLVWHVLVVVFLIITAWGGSEFMRAFLSMPLKAHISLFLEHLIWGMSLGLLYEPPKDYNS
ncbi:MAG TPA: hypothetical protein EYH58_01105 [Aquifex aeolicus]|nr:hypothetical protein [Aquifex aeolicus]